MNNRRKSGKSLLDWRKIHDGLAKNSPSSVSKPKKLTMEEVGLHNTREDCWVILNGKIKNYQGLVYDVTSFLEYHPGGVNTLLEYAGKDATQAFNQETQFADEHNSLRGNTLSSLMNTPRYLIGDNTCRVPTMTILGASIQPDDNKIADTTYPQSQNAFSSCQENTIESQKEVNEHRWTPYSAPKDYSNITAETQTNGNVISWGSVMPTHAYIQQSNQTSDDNVGKFVVFANHVPPSSITNYTLMTSTCQTPQSTSLYDSLDFWQPVDSVDYRMPKENNQSIKYSNDFKIQHGIGNNDIVQNGFNNINQIIFPQYQENGPTIVSSGAASLSQFPKNWLLSNFERVDDESTIARGVMYNYYVYACHERGETPMNSAGLGKVIRTVFGPIKNRRLGARSKSGKLSDSRSCDSSTELREFTRPSSTEIEKISQDLKYLEDLEKQPLSSFREHLEGVTKFKIFVKWENKDTLQFDEKMDKRYTAIFTSLNSLFTELGSQLIIFFRDQDETGLTNAIKTFWLSEHTVYCYTDPKTKYNVELRLPYCLNEDENIQKYVNCYDCAFLQLLLDKTVNHVIEKISLSESLVNYCVSFKESKLNSIKRAIETVKEATDVVHLRITILQTIKFDSSNVLKNFTVKLEVLEEMFANLATAPLSHSSQEWFHIIEEIHSKALNNSDCDKTSQFIKEWCIYQTLLCQYLFTSDNETNPNLLLSNLSVKLLFFRLTSNLSIENPTSDINGQFQKSNEEFV